MFSWLNLHFRLLLGFVLVLTIAASGLLWQLQGLLRKQTLERATDYHIELVNSESLKISNAILDGSLLAMSLSQQAELRKLLVTTSEDSRQRAELRLRKFLESFQGFSAAAILGADYRLILASEKNGAGGTESAAWEEFFSRGLDPFNAMARVPVFIDPLQKSAGDAFSRIRYTIPISDENSITLGILALDYDLDELLRSLDIATHPFAYLVLDEFGQLLYGEDPMKEFSAGIESLVQGELRELADQLTRSRSGHSIVTIGASDYLLTHARLIAQEHISSPITLAQLIPLARIYAPVRFVNEAVAISTLVTFLIILFLLGIYAFRVVSPVQMLADLLSAYKPGGTLPLSPRMLRRNDEMGRLFRAFGELNQALIEAFDERDRQFAILREKNLLLQQKTEEARHLAKAKSDFLAIMSHEIRTPLNAIVGFSQLMCEETDPEESAYASSRILANSQRLLALIDNILDFTRIQSGWVRLAAEPFDLRLELQTIQEGILPRTIAAGIDFHLDVVDSKAYGVAADVVRWRQVVNNLVNNAVKFTPAGCVSVVARLREDEDTSSRVWLQVEVRDTGIGIPSNTLERIFQPFEQSDTSLQRRYEGSGLGLAICEKLVTLMGGTIEVESTLGKGSNFSFEIPCLKVPLEQLQAAGGEALNHLLKTKFPLGGARFLLVEDDESNADVLCRHLLKWGALLVHCARNRAEFGSRIESVQYDLIFMDLHLPGANGMELIRYFRTGVDCGIQSPSMPVIVLSAYTEPELAREALRAGATRFFTKPASHKELLEAAHAALQSARAP